MNHRTKYDIWVEILEVCTKFPRHQSWILRELNLKNDLVKNSLKFLLERGLVEEFYVSDDKWVSYQTTEKGKNALVHFYRLIAAYFKP